MIATISMASQYKCSACRKWVKGKDFAEHTFGHEVRSMSPSADGRYSITEASHIIVMTSRQTRDQTVWRARNPC